MIVRSPVWIAAAAAAVIHLSGIAEQIAQPLGALGTIIVTVDKAVAEITGVRKFIVGRTVVRPAVKKTAATPKKAN